MESSSSAETQGDGVGTTVIGNEQRNSRLREVRIPREVIRLSPLSGAIISHTLPDGHQSKTGYVKLSAFSQTAAMEMEDTISTMKTQGVQSFILDLRNNPGGLVKAGLDVAQIWLDGDETLVNTIDRSGNLLPISMVNGHAITHDPLVVLGTTKLVSNVETKLDDQLTVVNEGSAKRSEICRAPMIMVEHFLWDIKHLGRERYRLEVGTALACLDITFHSVTELHDGSALFITVAKYLSPALHDIDQVGITPDITCTTDTC
ncbi:hypothetical protein Leryth_001265 [Lithospermum erythrorhizon]|nr:hypothetical protein Leryth_001265 [Lithospermum erythrorhizon]